MPHHPECPHCGYELQQDDTVYVEQDHCYVCGTCAQMYYWQCGVCDSLNHDTYNECEVCHEPRYSTGD